VGVAEPITVKSVIGPPPERTGAPNVELASASSWAAVSPAGPKTMRSTTHPPSRIAMVNVWTPAVATKLRSFCQAQFKPSVGLYWLSGVALMAALFAGVYMLSLSPVPAPPWSTARMRV
jgi:hypothetical protein